jgi:hypothetical protein
MSKILNKDEFFTTEDTEYTEKLKRKKSKVKSSKLSFERIGKIILNFNEIFIRNIVI